MEMPYIRVYEHVSNIKYVRTYDSGDRLMTSEHFYALILP